MAGAESRAQDLNSCICLYNNMKRPKILHYPQLDTVLMVEDYAREHSGEYRKRAFWENLPRKMMYQTFCVIISYLSESGKVAIDRNGKIAWVWNPALVKRYLSKPGLKA